jgi:hypothetical protein
MAKCWQLSLILKTRKHYFVWHKPGTLLSWWPCFEASAPGGRVPHWWHFAVTYCLRLHRKSKFGSPWHNFHFILVSGICQILKVKVKWSRYRPGVAQRVGRGIALLFHDHGTRRGWMVSSTPRPHFTPRKDLVPILQEAGWAQGRSGWAEILVPTGIRSRTVQPVVSRYTDWATRPTYAE